MDNLEIAQQQMDDYWSRTWDPDADLDTQQRQAELLQVIAHALLAIAENGRRAPE